MFSGTTLILSALRNLSTSEVASPATSVIFVLNSLTSILFLRSARRVAASRASASRSNASYRASRSFRLDTCISYCFPFTAPKFLNISFARRIISISADTSSTPKMSQLSCQCSRSRPRCIRSYRKRFGIEYQRTGKVSSRRLPAIMRATVGVISGRRVTSRSPRSVKV